MLGIVSGGGKSNRPFVIPVREHTSGLPKRSQTHQKLTKHMQHHATTPCSSSFSQVQVVLLCKCWARFRNTAELQQTPTPINTPSSQKLFKKDVEQMQALTFINIQPSAFTPLLNISGMPSPSGQRQCQYMSHLSGSEHRDLDSTCHMAVQR